MRQFGHLAIPLFFCMVFTGAEVGHPIIEIQTDGWASADEAGSYIAGRPMVVKAVISSVRAASVIVLKDHDADEGTLAYPTSVVIRVVSEEGRVLTDNEVSHDEWWSWYYLQSSFSSEMPGDAITLGPGESLVRKIPIDVVLRGCPGIETGLAPGAYWVQLRIDGVLSNELRITVRPAE